MNTIESNKEKGDSKEVNGTLLDNTKRWTDVMAKDARNRIALRKTQTNK